MDRLMEDVTQFESKIVLFLGWNPPLNSAYRSNPGEYKLPDPLM